MRTDIIFIFKVKGIKYSCEWTHVLRSHSWLILCDKGKFFYVNLRKIKISHGCVQPLKLKRNFTFDKIDYFLSLQILIINILISISDLGADDTDMLHTNGRRQHAKITLLSDTASLRLRLTIESFSNVFRV